MYTLYSFGTPNGFKPTILLEELKVAYKIKLIDIQKDEQFDPDFLKISPNNKIPALYDDDLDLSLFESVAILEYLAEKHQKFLSPGLKEKFTTLQWCYFQVGHVGPMFGQYGHFHKYAKKDIPYAKERYDNECHRIMAVIDRQLMNHAYISGEDYTIADIAIWPWMHCYQNFYGATIEQSRYPYLTNWYKSIEKRKAVQVAIHAYP